MENYPVHLNIDYSEQSNRVTVFFRIFLAIPILIILALLTSESYVSQTVPNQVERVGTIGVVVLPAALMILFRKKYPKWWFDWNLALMKFSMRVGSYLLFLRDEYPSTDEEQAVHLDIPYPDANTELNRWMPLVKWFLAIPHIIVLGILLAAVVFVSIIAWFAILFSGRYPKSLFDFVVGFMRWSLRVFAYAALLTTDQYPPFRLSE